MATPLRNAEYETTNTNPEHDYGFNHLPHRDKSPSTNVRDLASFDLPERFLISDHAIPEVENGRKICEEAAEDADIRMAIRGEEDHKSISEEPLAREHEMSNLLPDDQESVFSQANGKDKLPIYRTCLILRGHKKGIAAVKYSPDGRRIASCSADGTVKTWNAKTGDHEHTFEAHLAGVSIIAWSPNSDVLASGSDDKTIRLWYTSTGKAHPVPFIGHHNYIYSLAFSPKGNMIVSGSYDETIFIWDVRTARVLRSLPAHSDPVGGVDFVRDGTLIASCSSDGLIRIWDTATGQCLRTLIHEDNVPVVAVRFSPNGRYVLAWTLDSCLRLWNYVEGRCVKTYQGHRNIKYSLSGAFGTYGEQAADYKRDPTGNFPNKYAFIVSGSEDHSLILWDVSSKNILQRLLGHEGAVLGVDTHPTEQDIVSCSLDRTIRVWRDDSAEVKRED